MLSGKQIGIILAVTVMVIALYLLPVKGLVVSENEAGAENQGTAPDLETLVAAEKQNINASLLVEIEQLEQELAEQPGDTALLKKLAVEWEGLNINNISGLYYLQLAEKQAQTATWLKAGDKLRQSYQAAQDTMQRSFLIDKAMHAYQKALEQDPESIKARIGLGAATVEGGGPPMQGIQLLLGVVEEEPENPEANLTLGKFSMQSGQFEKAKDRFLTVIENKPNGEAWFYLGEAYRQLGNKEEAIAAYEETKKYIVDPQFVSMVDEVINGLK